MVQKLPEGRKQLQSQYVFKGKNIDDVVFSKRRIAKLLPGVNQTETLQKFFNATADHLFEPGASEPLNGYVGRAVDYAEAETNYYLPESTREREFYQLEPSMVSKAQDGTNQSLLFYEDLINNLRFQGGITNNHHRMFSQSYYSWCPSVDLDKFLNFREYVWLPEGPQVVDIWGHAAVYTGNGRTQVFAVNADFPAPVVAGFVQVLVDGVEVPFTYNSGEVTVVPAPARNAVVRVFTAISIQSIVGLPEFVFANSTTMESNLRIRIRNDIESSEIGKIYIIEGVGEKILLIPDDTPDLSLKQDYMVMQRGSADANAWSQGNRWFHKKLALGYSKNQLREVQAKRPIIEFARNIALINSGTSRRPHVDLVVNSGTGFYDAVNGLTQSKRRFDGVSVERSWIDEFGQDGAIRVLVTSDDDSRIVNRVYRITYNATNSKLKATLVADGADVSGAPTVGETLSVRWGASYANSTLFWNGNVWQTAQRKLGPNQFPLFDLFDTDGVSLSDSEVYPNSDFKGSRLFGYREDPTLSAVVDKILGIRVVHDAKGEIVFENYLGTTGGTYRRGVDQLDLPTKAFYKRSGELLNDWYLVDTKSRQMVVDNFIAQDDARLFQTSQEPVEPLAENLRVYRNNTLQTAGIDYIHRFNQILMVDLENGDHVDIKTFNPATKPQGTLGQYEVPLNLQANPKWEQVGLATRGDLFEQFVGIIRGQTGFSGIEYSANNWKDIAHDLSLGRFIVSHSAPLLRTMLLNSNRDLDLMKAASYAQDEYARFRGKFDQKINEFMVRNALGTSAVPDDWVELALEEITRGMTQDFAFYHSRMGLTENSAKHYFIPPTPSFLGIFPIQKPSIYVDPINSNRFIIGHDGRYFPFYEDIRDAVTFQLETRIYESAPQYIRDRESGFFDYKSLVSNKWYSSDYTVDELNLILRPMFEKWSVNFGIDYRTNDSFDANDPFSWNWSSCVDRDNRLLPGHWRGIYAFYYGTDRPHTHPWEMLGFEYMPQWWVARYGTAPYGSDNVILWEDLQEGRIAGGPTPGTYERFAKPGLMNMIPVDSQGNLLDPLAARVTANAPRSVKAADEWIWGDGAPAEAAWKQSFWFPFAAAMASYLMKPASFVETTWDIERNLDTLSAKGYGFPYESEYVHGETQYDGTQAYRHGTQQWIVDYLRSKNKAPKENLGDLVRGLDVRLAHKVAGFTDQDSLVVVSDNIDRLPAEDVGVELYKSPSVREEFLGGIIVRKASQGYRIYGYDILDPVFKIIPSDITSTAISITVGAKQTPRIPTWHASTFYPINTTVRYIDKYYRAIRAHTSLRSFEPEYWLQVARPQFADTSAVDYYLEPKVEGAVERVAYGTTIRTNQEMATFVSGYERYLEAKGWKFEQVANEESTSIFDWKLSLRDFLAWTQSETTVEGSMITLIPNSGTIQFQTDHGNIEPIEQIVNGVYSILDKLGNPIRSYNTNVVREDGEVFVTTRSNQEMYACRLHISEIEHAVVVSNTTIFGDAVYSPLFNIRQNRLRLQGFKTKFWKGRIDAPGFIVSGNRLIPNFEKAADDFRRLFDIESIEDNDLKNRGRANYGYQEKAYLSNLLMTPTNQFEFHQGVIQQKGTINAMRKLFRSSFIRHNEGLNVLEEWGFRLGEYGASETRPSMDFLIKQADFRNSPQLFEFNGSGQGGWDLRLAWDMDHWDYLRNVETVRQQFSIKGIRKVKVTQSGSGYTEVPQVNIVGDTSGAQLRAILNWNASKITNITISRGGSGYFEGDPVEFDGNGVGATAIVSQVNYAGSRILSVFVVPTSSSTSAGSGYSLGEIIRFTNGNGTARAKITQVDTNGAIVALAVTTPGAGYTGAVTTVIWPNGNASAAGRLGHRVSGGRIEAIQLSEPGQGYDPATTLRVIGTGRGFIGGVEVSGGSVSGVEVVNRGGGFASVPVVEFIGDATTIAAAEALLEDFDAGTSFDIVKFKRAKGVILKSMTIRVASEFRGIQPLLTVGDASDNARYVSEIDLGVVQSKTFSFDIGDAVTNEEEEITAYISNAQDAGSVEITLTFEFTPNYYEDLFAPITDDHGTKIYDMFNKETGEFMHKDSRWVWRHDTQNPDWPLISLDSDRKGNLPSAGYVHLDDIDWTATNNVKFNQLYRSAQAADPAVEMTKTRVIEYRGDYSARRRKLLVPNLNKGQYRVKSFVISITEAFPMRNNDTPEMDIAIGTTVDPELYMAWDVVDTTKIQEYTQLVYEFVESKQLDENAIYVFVRQHTGLSTAPGHLEVTSNVELIGNQVVPRDTAWVYNKGHNVWDVQRLGDTGMNIENTYIQSHDTQGTVIATNRDLFEALGIDHDFQQPTPAQVSLNPTFADDIAQAEARMDRVILDGIVPDNDSTEMLLNTYRARLHNSVKLYVDASISLQNNGTALVQIPLMDLQADTGLVINRITASVIRPFDYPAGNNPTLTIGTLTDRDRFVGAVNSVTAFRNVKDAPTRPTFSYAEPISVSIYDDAMVLNEQDTTASIRVLRTGNLFVTPSAITVDNGGWGYSEGTPPKVTVTGPTGVVAEATLKGTIIGFEVVDPGHGYTSVPQLQIVGGGGTGAKGTPVIRNGKLKRVTLSEGTASGSLTLAGDKIDTLSVTGSGWETTPIITFEGGNPKAHGSATSTVDDNGDLTVELAYKGLRYKSAPTVKITPTTGLGFTSTPQLFVSGGGGSGATVKALMMWRVDSIRITDWGKCSWVGDGANVRVEAPEGGAPATAHLEQSPATLEDTTVAQWRYRKVVPTDAVDAFTWNYSDTPIVFPAATGTNGPDFWRQRIEFPLGSVDERTQWEVEIPPFVVDTTTGLETSTPNVTNGTLGVSSSNVTVNNTLAGSRDINLLRAGTKEFYLNDRISEEAQMVAFYNSDGASDGLITLVVDYHYTSGFELFQQSPVKDVPVTTAITGAGGDVFAWNSVRFDNYTQLSDLSRIPVDGFQLGDRVLLDDGRPADERAAIWDETLTYQYHDLVQKDAHLYRAIQTGSGLVATITAQEDGQLNKPQITATGTLYSHEPTVTLTGDGTGAAAIALLEPTGVYRIKILNMGLNYGYTGNETVVVTPNTPYGHNATARITKVVDGSIREIVVVDKGWGYNVAPSITILNDTASVPVQAEAIMVPTRIKAILMLSRGADYTSATLSFSDETNTQGVFDPQEWEAAEETQKGWRVLEYGYNGFEHTWSEIRRETPKVDTDLIESAVIYDIETGETLQTLQLYDPFKGYIPGSAKKEISYILEYDPAIYSAGPLAKNVNSNEKLWDSAKVGDIWWDISRTKYLDYEIGDTDYKWANWGNLAPGSTVNVYEWTRSTVAPLLWDAEVEKQRKAPIEQGTQKPTGSVKGILGSPSWVERTEYNRELNRNELVYYFWVKNAATVPARPDRELTARQIASLIADPKSSDIPWFAVVDTNKVIIGGSKAYVNDYSSSLKINWKRTHGDALVHKQFKLLREGDERNTIDESLWNKMRDSLVGWDKNSQRRTLSAILTSTIQLGTTSFTVDNADEFDLSGEIKINDFYLQYEYRDGNRFMGVSGVGSLRFGAGTLVQQSRVVEGFRKVPNQWLNERERYGNLQRPAQTWFRTDTDAYGFLIPGREARKTLVESLNKIFRGDTFLDSRYEWSELFALDEPEPLAASYAFRVANEFERDQLSALELIQVGQKVLMDGTSENNGLWTLWVYLPGDSRATISGFVRIRAQRYRMREGELWTAVDWYDSEWSTADYPVKRYATKAQRDMDPQVGETLLRGTLVRVDSQGPNDPRWAWYVFANGSWKMVAKEKATIQLSDAFYAQGKLVYGLDEYNTQSSKKRDGSWELQILLDGLRTKLLTSLERNELFFSMVRTAVSQHDQTDWIFKTSFLYMAGYDEKLSQSPIVLKDQTQNVLDYLEDIKPYHVKIRDFVRRLSPAMELVNLSITDFDKPMWYDAQLGAYRKLDVTNPVDVRIMQADTQLTHWFDNYKKTNYQRDQWDTNWNPIRRPRIRMLFDRVSCSAVVGWDQPDMPWDGNEQRWRVDDYTRTFAELEQTYRIYGTAYAQHLVEDILARDTLVRNSQKLVNAGSAPLIIRGDVVVVRVGEDREVATFMWTGAEFVQFYNILWDRNYVGGLADRIDSYYEPTATMRRKELDTLIRGCDFRGTVVDGSDNGFGLWDMFAWDLNAGWDNEYEYYVGKDLNINPVSSGNFDETEAPEDIRLEGGEMTQPWFDGGHPDELNRLRVRDPLVMTVYRKPTASGNMVSTHANTFRFFKDSLETWEGVYLEDDGLSLAVNLLSTDQQVVVTSTGALDLHDPTYTTNGIKSPTEVLAYTAKLRSKLALSVNLDLSKPIKASKIRNNPLLKSLGLEEAIASASANTIVNTLIEARLDQILATYTEGVVWIGTERITYRSIVDNANGSYTLGGVTRATGGTSRSETVLAGSLVLDGSVLHALNTWNARSMRAHSVMDFTKNQQSWHTAANALGVKPGPVV